MKNICKSFGDRAILNNISMTISRGDFLAITGKSGSGKSTFANILGLLDHNFSIIIHNSIGMVILRKTKLWILN